MNISLKSLEEAVGIRRQIDTLENRLSNLIGRRAASTGTMPTTSKGRRRGRRTISAAHRAKLAAAARARWAKRKGAATAAAPQASARGRKGRTISAAHRAKLAAAARARWARIKGSGGGSQTTTAKRKKGRGITAAGRRKLSEMMKARGGLRKGKQQCK